MPRASFTNRQLLLYELTLASRLTDQLQSFSVNWHFCRLNAVIAAGQTISSGCEWERKFSRRAHDNRASFVSLALFVKINTTGWADIGYNFLVGEDGNAYEGRGWDRVGAHATNYNSVSLGISVIGSFSSKLPNDAALNVVQKLISCGVSNVSN